MSRSGEPYKVFYNMKLLNHELQCFFILSWSFNLHPAFFANLTGKWSGLLFYNIDKRLEM